MEIDDFYTDLHKISMSGTTEVKPRGVYLPGLSHCIKEGALFEEVHSFGTCTSCRQT